MERVFENAELTAFLDKGIFENEALVKQCVSDVLPYLKERPTIHVFGKECHQQRDIGFFSNTSLGYKYSKKLMTSQPLSPAMNELLLNINDKFGTEFNGILVNTYIDGTQYISAHSDDETGLDPIGVISLSYGAERKFRIRNKVDKKIVHEENTTHCSLLHMGGNFQELYTHEIPIQKKIKETRISFTFRKHNI